MSLKSIAARELRVYTELVQSLNRDDATLEEIKAALEKRRYIISVTPSRLSAAARLNLLRDVVYDCLFVGSDVQEKRRKAGELDSILFFPTLEEIL